MNYSELAAQYERGEISFEQFMTTEATPDARKPASHYRKGGGRKAAARQGEVLAARVSSLPESMRLNDSPESNQPAVPTAGNRANAVQPALAESAPVGGTGGGFQFGPGNLATAEVALKFLTAGNAHFTVRSLKTGTRYTFRVALAAVKESCSWCMQSPCRCARPYFVSYLSGPENTADYTYLGMLSGNQFRATKASQRLAESTVFKAFSYVYRHLVQRELPPLTELWHEGRCGRCGRTLTVPESIAAGIGPECAGKLGL